MNDLKHLTEDLASETQAADLLPTVERLQTWRAPSPTPADTARLLATLTPALPSRPRSFSPFHLLSSSPLPLFSSSPPPSSSSAPNSTSSVAKSGPRLRW